MVKCYYCSKSIPQGEVKRCGRCRLVTYCSKQCQTISWKASHKLNCRPHPSVLLPNGDLRTDKPQRGTDERFQLDIDMALSAWMAKWRGVFQTHTVLALDIANHPPDRAVTHCLYLVVEPFDPDVALDKCKKYRLVRVEVMPAALIDALFPEFGGIVDDPSDHTRARFVLMLRDTDGEPLRMRRVQWNDLNILRLREKRNPGDAELARMFKSVGPDGQPTWVGALVGAVEHTGPEDIPRALGGTRDR